jgi:hypothetical protein
LVYGKVLRVYEMVRSAYEKGLRVYGKVLRACEKVR